MKKKPNCVCVRARLSRWSKHSTSHISRFWRCVVVWKLLSLYNLMMPNTFTYMHAYTHTHANITIQRMNQSSFYLVFDCLKIEPGQFCHVINRCNFLESNCITITFRSIKTLHGFSTNTHTQHPNNNENENFFSVWFDKTIQSMMNWACLIWPLRINITIGDFRYLPDLALRYVLAISQALFYHSPWIKIFYTFFRTEICFVWYKTKSRILE